MDKIVLKELQHLNCARKIARVRESQRCRDRTLACRSSVVTEHILARGHILVSEHGAL